ncbi:VOC family protein [Paracoccus alkanivorans]|uniref:VOC family protein n=1 Tax=Paracoccus alkanivorans TaxID=2116655 RepID=A0A3M0M2F1_9RHOB|nr:glyoxalase/bleomycin resistance/extradiol dioxygenase family protein [Paracoccus alkanivorans]RMC30574.1 VOC family protein [Paracoccus alkanivorans]
MQPTIYLFFRGSCLEAITHYAETLGGEITGVFRNGDAEPDQRMPGGDDMVMNMAMKLGSSMVMASDSPDEMYDRPQGFYVHIETPSRAEFDRVFAALSKDAETVAMAPAETFWAERFTMFRDRFGTPWMLSFTGSKAQGNG